MSDRNINFNLFVDDDIHDMDALVEQLYHLKSWLVDRDIDFDESWFTDTGEMVFEENNRDFVLAHEG